MPIGARLTDGPGRPPIGRPVFAGFSNAEPASAPGGAPSRPIPSGNPGGSSTSICGP